MQNAKLQVQQMISTHAPRTGSDANYVLIRYDAEDFNPRSPHGERPYCLYIHNVSFAISTHAPRTGSDDGGRGIFKRHVHNISTHAPRTGSDLHQGFGDTSQHISTHAPRTGSDTSCQTAGVNMSAFQPTLPARGATTASLRFEPPPSDFNPRSPHGERQRKVTILSTRIRGFAQKVYHKTVLLRIILAENAVILPEKPRNPVRTSLQKAGGLRFARAIRAAHPYSISSPSGA